jgi:ABC-type polysaccharide/polyol phosphate export permease
MLTNVIGHWHSVVFLLIARDFKVRYRASFFGYLWSMLNPLLMMAVLSLVFSFALKQDIPRYPAFILSGLVFWNLFSQSIHLGKNCFLDNASLLKKVKVPAWVFPTAVIGSSFVHAGLALIPYFGIAGFLGVTFNIALLQVPALLILYFIFIEGIVLALGSLNVFFRDLGHMTEPILQIAFYATPIIYPVSALPPKYQWVMQFNPLAHYIEGFRASLFEGSLLSSMTWLKIIAIAFFSFVAGQIVFKSTRNRFLYYI